MASHTVSSDIPSRHGQKPTVKDVQVMLEDLYVLREARSDIPREYADEVAKLQPLDLQKRMAIIEKKHAASLAALYPANLDERRDTIEEEYSNAMTALLPPNYHERIAALEQKRAKALAKLEPSDLSQRRAALDQERMEAIAKLVPPDLEERRRDLDEQIAIRQARIDQSMKEKEDEIRAAARMIGLTVRAQHLQVTYTPGRRSWNTDRLLRLAQRDPEIQECLEHGDPIVTIRVVTHKPSPPLPRLYDHHG